MGRRAYIVFLLVTSIASLSIACEARARITLQPHQERPLQYLLDKPNIKGLLIYHGIGTGKTFLSLAVSERLASKKVYLVMPRFLKSSWKAAMAEYQIKAAGRYQMLSFEEAISPQAPKSYRGAIVIVDEAHKLVARLRSSRANSRRKYAKLYFALQEAQRILALTGTPLVSNPTDIAYLHNLVAAKSLLPYDEQRFRIEYTKVIQHQSLLRGYLTESKFVDLLTPVFALGISGLLLPVNWVVVGFLSGSAVLPLIRSSRPASTKSFRMLDRDKFKAITEKYVSFYEASEKEQSNYPTATVKYSRVPYSTPQANLFFDFADQSLNPKLLHHFVPGDNYSPKQLELNSSEIQAELARKPDNGREIGNLYLEGVESPKFQKVLAEIKKSWGSIAVYSNYYESGILAFAAFLDRHGHKGSYRILRPDTSMAEQSQTLKRFNSGTLKILLLHPEITEGISLRGTDQLHILEPVTNVSLQDQIVGRTVRFKSHAHLPAKRRKVNVFVWVAELRYRSGLLTLNMSRDSRIRRSHYLRKYPEVNDNTWSGGIQNIDKNYHRKDKSPDEVTLGNMKFLSKNIADFKQVASKHSIEKVLSRDKPKTAKPKTKAPQKPAKAKATK